MTFITPTAQFDEGRIVFSGMEKARTYGDFIRCINHGFQNGSRDFKIDLREVVMYFPNASVPVSGIIEFFRQRGSKFVFVGGAQQLDRFHLDTPLAISDHTTQVMRSPLNTIWKFRNPDEINQLVAAFVREVSQQAVCEAGVLEGLTWCISEVMDNVLQHSKAEQGYVMWQIHKSTKHIAVCIFDYGQGIYNSLKDTQYSPRHPLDAITLAVKEGVTRDKNIGQGYGMWGLHNIVRSNSGSLAITSSNAAYRLRGNDIQTYTDVPMLSAENGATNVDFQIDFDKGISIADSLSGHSPISLRLESFENDAGNVVYKLSEKSSGTGTRQSGERIRNEVINLHNETRKVVELDFGGILVISSSFADELIGKLVAKYGFFGFGQIFKMKNMNDVIQSIVNIAVSWRMAKTFSERM